ncbi:kinase-like protein [Aspergillus campestris IBT 28561]|uniref:non-specific serine/threonine protein kinase n=1 Tax=Aspergillus campestris (strain IBT 28561) TaxID=1392248 RepID=A0A2I1D536_ASPC2|nr:kinase-like protein [Aspergillus campestris IBT 28561]PKY04968.1 kinase-like protein [Aspergillus campestris IBT 28561]
MYSHLTVLGRLFNPCLCLVLVHHDLMIIFGRTRNILRSYDRVYISPGYLHSRKPGSSLSTLSRREADKCSKDTERSKGSGPSGINPKRFQYMPIEYVEDLDRYCPGGYHPLQVGDTLDNGQYKLVDKLGYGGYSTTWLARDLKKKDRYVAVKVITADASASTSEASLIHALGKAPSKPGKEIIPSVLDQFWAISPNGKHRCIVTPPARMSLFDAKEASTFRLFQPKVAQSIIAQLIRGVAFLHSEGVVHGDLHLGNILVSFTESVDQYSTSELYKRYGEPEPEAVVRLDNKSLSKHVPSHALAPGWFGICSDNLPQGEAKIILSDFGESYNPPTTVRSFSNTLPWIQPPEARFSDEPLSFASEVWTLACTVWEIFGQRPFCDTFCFTADSVTAEQVQALGTLPGEWWEKWTRRSEWFNEEGELDVKYGACRTVDMRFDYCVQEPRAEAGMEMVTEEERKAFMDMIRSMLVFRPRDRATIQQVLNSEWMRGWGQPALRGGLDRRDIKASLEK